MRTRVPTFRRLLAWLLMAFVVLAAAIQLSGHGYFWRAL